MYTRGSTTAKASFASFQLSLSDVNALDRAGFWRMTDLTLDAAFSGKTLDDVTRDLEQFRHLGFWSDGRKVNPPIVGDDLSTIPRVIPANGLRIFPRGVAAKSSTIPEASDAEVNLHFCPIAPTGHVDHATAESDELRILSIRQNRANTRVPEVTEDRPSMSTVREPASLPNPRQSL